MTERPDWRASLEVSLANPRADRVKQIRALTGRSARHRYGRFLAEGPGAATAAVTHAAERVRDLYVAESAIDRHADAVEVALAAGLYVHVGTDEVLAAMSSDCQGIVAVVDIAHASLAEAVRPGARLIAIVADVRDPGNAGTVIRTADAAGADAVVLAGESVELANPKVVRASAGSVFHLPVVAQVSVPDAVAAAQEAGLTVVAADVSGAEGLGAAGDDGAVAWLFGNEARGLSAEHLALADSAVRIPIFGRAESLNLAAAAAVCLYSSAIRSTER